MSAGFAPYAIDPFGPSANPGAYVAFEASERARAALEDALDDGRIAALVGPPGHGKTLLLRLLAGREEERARVAYVPFARLEADELFALALSTLGVRAGASPREALFDLCGALAPRGGVVLLIDDAAGMSDACAASLAGLYREAGGDLRLALAAVEGADATRVLRAFGPDVDVVHLADGMSEREARRYVETRLAYGGARPEVVAAFDEETIEALHRASQGVPRRLNQAAEAVVRRAARLPLPRLREIAGLAEPERDEAPPVEPPPEGVEAAPPPAEPEPPAPRTPEASIHLSIVPDPLEPPTTDESEPAPVGVPAPPELPIPPAPPEPAAVASAAPPERPAPPGGLEPGGILLREAFEEGTGEYRLVRGQFVEADDGRPVSPDTPDEDARAAWREAEPPEVHDLRWLRQRSDVAPQQKRAAASARAASGVRAPRELPVRTLGLLGFALGIGGSLYWMSLSPTGIPTPRWQPDSVEVPAESPVPEASGTPDAGVAPARRDPFAPPAPPSRDPAPPVAPAPAPAPTAASPAPRPAPTPDRRPLAPAPPVAVSINATPWAVIYVDGRELGETPLAGIRLAPGVHVFRARMPDGTDREQAVEISPDNDTVVFQ